MNIIYFAQKYLLFIYGSCIWKHFKINLKKFLKYLHQKIINTSSQSPHQKEEREFVCMLVFIGVDICKHFHVYTYMIQLFHFLMLNIISMIEYTMKLQKKTTKECSIYSRGNNKIRYTYNSGLEIYKHCTISVYQLYSSFPRNTSTHLSQYR